MTAKVRLHNNAKNLFWIMPKKKKKVQLKYIDKRNSKDIL